MTTDPAELSEFSSAQAKVRTSYDDVPYASYPYPQSHPNRVAATATLLGLTPRAIETASVLEIGCAAGGNLIPMAAAYPQSRFLGIDLSSKQIDQARARAKRLGLANIEFRHQDVTSFEKSSQGYDYIICHGVYSWVSDPVRNAILNLCASNLTPDGIAYISYNVLPGWRPRQVVRDAMLAHVADIADPAQRLSQARAFIDFLKDSAPKSPYGEAIREVASWLGSMGGSYVFHEFLEIDNAPCTFKDFMKAANRNGLVFLGECELRSMLPENYGAVAPTIRTLGGNDVVAAEQYIDVFSGRTFRQTLLVPAARLSDISRNVSPDRLASLHFVSNLAAVASDDPAFPYVFKDPVGATFKTRLENVRRAFELIQANQPGSSSYRQLPDQLKAGGGRPLTPADEVEVLNSLQTALMIGLLTVSVRPVETGRSTDARPAALEVARSDAAHGTSTVNLRHEPVEIDVVARHLLPLLDGTNDVAALEASLSQAVKNETIAFVRDGQRVTDEAEIRTCVAEHLERVLRQLEGQAVLLPHEGD